MSPDAPEQRLTFEVPERGPVSAILTPASRPRWRFVYAPGAGSNLYDPFGRYAARALAPAGIETVRIQFPYMEAKRRSPDRTAVLEATWRAAIEAFGDTPARLVAGGRSMGGRISSQVVAQGVEVGALALFAYPLHPPGKPEQRRDAHLPSIRCPAFFCSGTRDAFATPEELHEAVEAVPEASLHLLDGADHGFAVAKSSGRARDDVWREAVDAFTSWLAAIEA